MKQNIAEGLYAQEPITTLALKIKKKIWSSVI